VGKILSWRKIVIKDKLTDPHKSNNVERKEKNSL
jgi:hypothetical protein